MSGPREGEIVGLTLSVDVEDGIVIAKLIKPQDPADPLPVVTMPIEIGELPGVKAAFNALCEAICNGVGEKYHMPGWRVERVERVGDVGTKH